MKHSHLVKKLFLVSILIALVSSNAFSYFKVDGIWYDFFYNNTDDTKGQVLVMPHLEEDENQGIYQVYDYEGDIVIPETVTFEGNNYTVTAIYEYAFYMCEKVTSVTLPKTITAIGYASFWNTGISKINLPKGLEYIGSSAFGWTKISELTIPSTCQYFNISPSSYTGRQEQSLFPVCFQSMFDLEKIEIEAGHPFYTSVDGVVYSADKSTLVYLPPKKSENFQIPPSVSALDNQCFLSCSKRRITIPSTIKQITPITFNTSLFEEIEFEKSDEPLKIAVKNWTSQTNNLGYPQILKKIIVDRPFSNTKFGTLIFSGWENPYQYKIILEMNSDHISFRQNTDGFSSVSVLRQLADISTAITTQPSSNYMTYKEALYFAAGNFTHDQSPYYSLLAFPGMSENKHLQIHRDCTEIPDEMFMNSRLESIDLPDNLRIINKNLFKNSTVENVRLGDYVEKLSESAFENCSNLKEIRIPESVEKIGADAFKNSGLLKIRLGANIDSLGSGVCHNCIYLEEAIIESGTRETTHNVDHYSIPTSAFYGCSALKKVDISERISYVHSRAFYNSMVDNGEIYMHNTIPPKYTTKYMGIPRERAQTITMYVPKGCGDAYRAYIGNISSSGVGFKIEEHDFAGIQETNSSKPFKLDLIPGGIEISGVGNEGVKIYTVNGQMAYSGNDGRILLDSGMYIIRIEGKTHKIFIK